MFLAHCTSFAPNIQERLLPEKQLKMAFSQTLSCLSPTVEGHTYTCTHERLFSLQIFCLFSVIRIVVTEEGKMRENRGKLQKIAEI
jgi:hypothetical protein